MAKRFKPRALFITLVLGYAIIAALSMWLLGNRADEAMLHLVLFGILPILLAAWTIDAIHSGEIWRQGPKSLTASLTSNTRRITRRDHPLSFWSAIAITWALSAAMIVFVILGIITRLRLTP